MRGRRLSLAAAIVALGALVLATGAQACSCIERTAGEALRESDAAIVGELVEVIPRNRLRADYRYRVQRVYRSAAGAIARGETISVRSARSSAACGLPSRTHHRYGLLLDEVHVEPLRGAKGEFRHRDGWVGGLCGVVAPRKLRSAARGASDRAPRSTGSSDCAS